jgi:CubicO group peptidase (beta-lactamase class C family)
MPRRLASLTLIIGLLFLANACQPNSIRPATNTETKNGSIITLMPTNTLQSSSDKLPTSARLGAVLTGSGIVQRSQLTYAELMTGTAISPVDDGAFALPEEAAMPTVVFEGLLQLSTGGETGGYKLIRDDSNSSAEMARLKLPNLDLQFVQDGSFLIPVTQGLVFSRNKYWNYIVGPGRIWQESGDHSYARISFPFTLVERNQNCAHNGVMTFLFDGMHVSQVRYQITQETCLYFKFDLWGQVAASFTPASIPQAAALKAAHATEVANRLLTKPITALLNDYPDAHINLANFSNGITPEHLTAYGLVINGVNYVSGCRTRYGEYAYCENLRLPSYSTAKSAFAAVALMRLGQKYGKGIYGLLIKDYVPEAALATGKWSAVTFENALNMSTGNYEQVDFETDEYGSNMLSFLDKAESYTDKIRFAFRYPAQVPPGEVWVYHSSDTFILTRAMNNYLVQREGSEEDIFNFVRDEVYIPLKLSSGALTTLRTDNSPNGAPFGGYGLFWTQDDIAKLALLLNVQNGNLGGVQLLEPGMLAAALQRDPNNRGMNTTGTPVFKHKAAFWAKQWTHTEARQYPCSFWTPFMSGYGGIAVVLMPNGSTYYYFSDNNEFSWYDAVNESNKLDPMCP